MSDNAENVIDFWRDKCKELTAEVETLTKALARVVDINDTNVETLTAEVERLREKRLPAYHLAVGSFGTAKDLGVLLLPNSPVLAEEFKSLAVNFERISELLKPEAEDD